MTVPNQEKENVKSLLPAPEIPKVKSARYVSKFAKQVGKETFEMGVPHQTHATMGTPNGHARCKPESFLRKNSYRLSCTYDKGRQQWEKLRTKPALPDSKERPVMGLVSDKNYVTMNAVETILSTPTKQKDSILWTQRKGFGRSPSYLRRLKAEGQSVSDQEKPQESLEWTPLSTDEKTNLLRQLKTKWAGVNSAYQKLTFTLDTPAKKKRKETLEALLGQIEKNIRFLESTEIVVVADEAL